MKRHSLLIPLMVCMAVLFALSGCVSATVPHNPGSSPNTPSSTTEPQTPVTPSTTPVNPGARPVITPTPLNNPTVINYFMVTPSVIPTGAYSSLSWSVSNATSVSIAGVGYVASSGRMPVQPSQTMTFTLTVTGTGGNTVATTTLTVTDHPQPSR